MDEIQIASWLGVALQVVGVASIIAALTPTPLDNQILGILKIALNALAANFAHAENKEKPLGTGVQGIDLEKLKEELKLKPGGRDSRKPRGK